MPPEISSLEFAKDLLDAVPTSANVRHYATIVQEKSMLRKLIKVNEEIANTCYLAKERTEDILEETEKKIFDLLQYRSTGDFVPIKQVVLTLWTRSKKHQKTKEPLQVFLPVLSIWIIKLPVFSHRISF